MKDSVIVYYLYDFFKFKTGYSRLTHLKLEIGVESINFIKISW